MDDPGSASIVFRLLTVIVLVAANSFFVAAEFALVAVRKTRIDQLANEGVRLAKQARRAVESLDRYISGTQLGITIASLGLGWIGEPAVATVIERFFDALPERTALIATHGVAVAIAFSFITFLHIVLGELAPKALALQHPETVSRWVAVPLIGFTRAMNPFIWLLNGSANLTLKLIGAKPPSEAERVHQPDEILMIVKQSGAVGPLAKQDVEMIEGVFEFTEKIARDVMTPRTQVTALSASLTLDEAAAQVSSAMRSRYPVFEDDLDDIVGVIHAKEILANLKESRFETLRSIARDPLFVPGSREVENLLTDMKRL
ncbi:MAG: hemolysin family protein, partial [Gemmatimonadales bacterium]